MKAPGILLLAILFLTLHAYGQKIYIRAGAGFTVSTAASYTPDYSSALNGYTSTSSKQGLGTGLPFVLAAGYNFNDHFSVELGVDYFYGFILKQKIDNSPFAYSSNDRQWHGQMLSIVPAFVMSLPLNKIQPYARFGLKLGVLNNVIYKEHELYNYKKSSQTIDVQSRSKDYGGIAVGAQAAVGTNFVLSNLISLFGEIQLEGISYSPTSGKYTEYIQDGTDVLYLRTVKQNSWNYVKTYNSSNNIPDNQPNEQTKRNHLFGNIGLLLGVKIKL